jgi:hypothetical protein
MQFNQKVCIPFSGGKISKGQHNWNFKENKFQPKKNKKLAALNRNPIMITEEIFPAGSVGSIPKLHEIAACVRVLYHTSMQTKNKNK